MSQTVNPSVVQPAAAPAQPAATTKKAGKKDKKGSIAILIKIALALLKIEKTDKKHNKKSIASLKQIIAALRKMEKAGKKSSKTAIAALAGALLLQITKKKGQSKKEHIAALTQLTVQVLKVKAKLTGQSKDELKKGINFADWIGDECAKGRISMFLASIMLGMLLQDTVGIWARVTTFMANYLTKLSNQMNAALKPYYDKIDQITQQIEDKGKASDTLNAELTQANKELEKEQEIQNQKLQGPQSFMQELVNNQQTLNEHYKTPNDMASDLTQETDFNANAIMRFA